MGLFSRKMTENRRQEKDDNMTPEKKIRKVMPI